MMNSTHELGPVFLEVAEKLAFMFGKSVGAEAVADADGGWVSARLDFHAERSGTLVLTVPAGMCREIAANILGLDPEDIANDAVAEDALKEMVNVVAGRVVPELLGEGSDFDLTVPRIARLDAAACLDLARRRGSACYELDGAPVVLSLLESGRDG